MPIPSPNFTPASLRIEAGERVSGGPTRTSFFSQVSGAGLAPVSMTGILASASSIATLQFSPYSEYTTRGGTYSWGFRAAKDY